ncbi:MAG: DUF2235 domain-containing protein [bacterium]|nr:DUF2235 domain-containing protein [Gammaproteobacteria bacterium]
MTKRNLVVLFDGTWNDTHSNSNVKKIYTACSADNQEFHYEEGVGTAHWEALPGGIYGANIDRQILGGYRFLRRRFQDQGLLEDQNGIFLFGFSRGSYAARRLAGLVDFCGLPVKAKDVDVAWHLYLNQDQDSVNAFTQQGRLFKVPIEALCVWDTVKTTTDQDFNDHKLPACVVAGYHAMAIDEKRKLFNVLKWNNEQRVRQVWFAGTHADVGGGHPQKGLSDIALKWMVDSAYKHGMRFKASEMKKVKPKPKGVIYDSYQGIWKPLGKKIRSVSKTALVHTSVKTRLTLADYSPGNLPPEPNYVKK